VRVARPLKPKIESDRVAASAFSRMDALASLLSDDSPSVLHEVRRAFEEAGERSRPALERCSRSADPRVRARARMLLFEREQRSALKRFTRYAWRPKVDLEHGLFLLARIHAPRLDPRPYQRALDAMAAEVAKRISGKSEERARVVALVEYLGRELRFGGSRGEFHHPDNIDLHRAIERRVGIPLTLSAIWLFVARRAGIRAALLPLPGHVMLRLYAGSGSVIVDPYHDGRTRTEAECRSYLAKHGAAANAAAFRDAPDANLLRRQVANLARSAELRGRTREARMLTALVRALEPRRSSGSLPR
jgi:regulator of sirC expression with transglutaminase-like and TPR domain